MKIYDKVLDEDIVIPKGSAVALGKFDGLHKGHRALIEKLKESEKEGLKSVVFTFTRAPKELLEHERQKYILTSFEKRLFMEKNGIDILIECPLSEEILSMEPEKFIEDILCKKLTVKRIICGEDFRFGHNRSGDTELLDKICMKYKYEALVIKKLKYNKRDISSTYIREAISKGNIELVNELLGYPYTVIGVVVDGNKLGRTMGFPTANLIPEDDKLLPPNGVYRTIAVVDEKEYRAITNIGTRPTVNGENIITIETNLVDVSIDLYEKTIELHFFEFIRPEKKFGSMEELKMAVFKDIDYCRKIQFC